jgi:adenine-specific DNA-methyltransferase
MSDTASIYVHLDWHIGHYVKIIMDEVFGEDKFLNEIIWCYAGNPKFECNNIIFQKTRCNLFIYKIQIRLYF